MKRLLTVLLAVMMVAMCIGANAEEEKLTLRFSWWGDTSRHEVYNKICDAFEAKNPDVTIVRESATWNDYWSKLATQIAGGGAPDIFGMHPSYVADYASRGIMVDLEPYFESGVIETTDIPQSILEGGRLGGKISMLSQGPSGISIFANKTLLEEVGVEVPDMNTDWTWDEFAAKAAEFRAKAKEKGIDAYFCDDMTTTFSGVMRVCMRAQGGELYTEDGKLDLTVDELAKFLGYWNDLRQADLIPDAATIVENNSLTLEQKIFTTGKTALTAVAGNQLYQYATQMPGKTLEFCRIPIGTDDPNRGEYLEGAFIAIYDGIDQAHKDAAARFINFFVNTEDSLQHLKMEQGMPTNSKMIEFVKPLLSPEQGVSMDYLSMTGSLQDHAVVYGPAGSSAVSSAYAQTCFESVAFGVTTPEEAAAAFITEAEAILAEQNN